MASRRDIVVIGGSAGSIETLKSLTGQLPWNLPAALFVVVHVLPLAESRLPEILDHQGTLPVRHARDGDLIRHGQLLVAPPDHHLVLGPDGVSLSRGPRENSSRPAIDPLFRSAAEAFGDRVLAIVLSGNLDDGSDGLRQVAEAGGMTVVQDPNEALHPEMPRNALASAPGSRVARIHDIAGLIKALAAESAEEATMVKEGGGAGESFYFDNPEAELGRADSPGSPTGLSCPECHGVLWFGPDQRSPNLHCRTGHKFTMKTLHNGQRSHVESAMWAAVRALQEEATLARTIAVKAQAGRREGVARRFLLREETARRHAAVLQGLLTEEVPEASWPDP